MTERLRVAVLGSTGSIGRQALDVAAANPERIEVVALSAHRSAELLARRRPRWGEERRAFGPRRGSRGHECISRTPTVGSGDEAVAALAALPDVDVVLNALVAPPGSRPWRRSRAARPRARQQGVARHRRGLVTGRGPGAADSRGLRALRHLPVPLGEDGRELSRIWLTASGGPFKGRVAPSSRRSRPRRRCASHLDDGPEDHRRLGDADEQGPGGHRGAPPLRRALRADHRRRPPQSCVHSMVEFSDGRVKLTWAPRTCASPSSTPSATPVAGLRPSRPSTSRVSGTSTSTPPTSRRSGAWHSRSRLVEPEVAHLRFSTRPTKSP